MQKCNMHPPPHISLIQWKNFILSWWFLYRRRLGILRFIPCIDGWFRARQSTKNRIHKILFNKKMPFKCVVQFCKTALSSFFGHLDINCHYNFGQFWSTMHFLFVCLESWKWKINLLDLFDNSDFWFIYSKMYRLDHSN